MRAGEESENKIERSLRRGVNLKRGPVWRSVGQKQEELNREDGEGVVVGVKRFCEEEAWYECVGLLCKTKVRATWRTVGEIKFLLHSS